MEDLWLLNSTPTSGLPQDANYLPEDLLPLVASTHYTSFCFLDIEPEIWRWVFGSEVRGINLILRLVSEILFMLAAMWLHSPLCWSSCNAMASLSLESF